MGRAELLELQEATKQRTREGSGNTITQKAYRDFTLCGVYPTCKPVNAPDSTAFVNDL